jgi:protein-S-isoprenylcysteine O-methyltransferase Ste14
MRHTVNPKIQFAIAVFVVTAILSGVFGFLSAILNRNNGGNSNIEDIMSVITILSFAALSILAYFAYLYGVSVGKESRDVESVIQSGLR